MKHLLGVAEERGLWVEWDPRLGENLWGYTDVPARTVVLNSRMAVTRQKYALAHELGHAWHNHTWTGRPHEDETAERLADEYAARLLIDPAEFVRAEQLVGPHAGAIALELGTVAEVITVWQRLLRKVPCVRYATPLRRTDRIA
ncbi:ImmA/IrrE family metallo-endopeptidase [Cellulosimicrobium sp. JZ28]|uniref:ImmA/IrrE family metallo-endopeptidase n=1 Tax=Cellulosimicrobium sp. JZ28 TaxID=1906273 RepID=UPI00188C0728|nr:ImmA/IrrE family metallo-endopeptidase [Cellulosimicrobium sp. JZ28]